ncbi:MAG: exopolyphosphatase [Micromonosporaceae bacterium]|nr:exopolyphosphatase [Micromonosporaceae bacterium]
MAAIDCGTNSIRLLVADLGEAARSGGGAGDGGGARGSGGAGDGAFTDVVRRMEIVRLGQDVDRTGRLAADALARTRAALADYAAQLRDLGAERVRMVATSATRDAENAEEFHAMVTEVLGAAPEVVTGQEEAHLSFIGAVRGAPADAEPPYLVVDIGGGSTEFVRGTRDAEAAISVDIGCVRMTERHLRGDPPNPAEIAAAEADVAEAVRRALAAVSGKRARTLVGLAGSVTTVAGIALNLPEYDSEAIHHAEIGYDAVAEVTAELLRSTREQRLAIGVMHPGRADVIAGGALILRVIMEQVSAASVIASEHDILDGIALSLA